MSRVILSRWDNNQEHVVVGWDAPMSTFFWQEFNREPDDWDALSQDEQESWEEMAGFGGYMHGELPSIEAMRLDAEGNDAVMNAISAALETRQLAAILSNHMTLAYPASNVEVDLSTKE